MNLLRRYWDDRLPAFPWDRLAEPAERAGSHPDGMIDLSMGNPVDPVAPQLQRALASGAEGPGYPATRGTAGLREQVAAALWRRHGVSVSADVVLPTIGSKELVAGLPSLLGLGSGDVVAIPELAYPTYEVGARIAGARPVRYRPEAPADLPAQTRLLWWNSPANPTGRLLEPEHARAMLERAHALGAVVASDECYLDMWYDRRPHSLLHPEITGGDHTGVLALHSLSKSANLAGYRAGYVTGDEDLVMGLLQVRKQAGMIVPRPVQAAIAAAVADDELTEQQRLRYAARRARLLPALRGAGYQVEHSEAGLYLWATSGQSCWHDVKRLAELGILLAPGEFYGPAGANHVRVALTASDDAIDAACSRLS